MICGIGTDIVAVERIEAALERHGVRLARRVLTEAEHAAFERAGGTAAFLARRFAAKEAAAKALGTGFSNGVTLRDLEVSHDGWGKPELTLHRGAAARAQALQACRAELSLSDERAYALAFVVLVGE